MKTSTRKSAMALAVVKLADSVRQARGGFSAAPGLLLVLSLLFGSPGLSSAQLLPASQPRSERELIDVLKSNAGLQEKDAACAELKRVGTALSVPVLAELLTDEQLSHTARFALESLPAPEAGLALTRALDTTTGLTRVGIVNSLGRRREGGAVNPLTKLLGSSDSNAAGAAARALGRIGGPAAIDGLLAALPVAREPMLRSSVLDGLLRAANLELAAGRSAAASNVFARIHGASAPDYVRGAAYRGLIASADEGRALKLISLAIRGNDGPEQMAALEMGRVLKSAGVTKALGESLALVQPPAQVALIEALRQRGDPEAVPSILTMMKSPALAVRVAALAGLGELGDQSVVPPLLEAASSTDEAEIRAARQALLVLRRGDIASALILRLNGGRPASIVEAARALAGRGDHEAVGSLTTLARQNSGPARAAACLALGQLAEATDFAGLVGLVVAATDDAAREQARDALGAACLRLKNKGESVDAGPIVAGLATASPEARAALLQAGSALSDERLRTALRGALADGDQSLRAAAERSLTETRDPAFIPDLMTLARQSSDLNRRVAAVRGYVRLVADMDNLNLGAADRVKALADILPLARAEERWGVLACLAKVPDTGALALALSMLDEPATRAEAAQAVTATASRLTSTHPEHARMGLERVMSGGVDPGQREAALAASQAHGSRLPGPAHRLSSGVSSSTPPFGARAWLWLTSTGTAVWTSPRETSSISVPTGSPCRCSPPPRPTIPKTTATNFCALTRTSTATAGST